MHLENPEWVWSATNILVKYRISYVVVRVDIRFNICPVDIALCILYLNLDVDMKQQKLVERRNISGSPPNPSFKKVVLVHFFLF